MGMINWFAVHGTSLDNKNTLISGDNKGYAAYRFEEDFPKQNFVAAFAQTDAGDVSPNLIGHGGGFWVLVSSTIGLTPWQIVFLVITLH